jgi:DNA-binding transcriptional LysR family regulator
VAQPHIDDGTLVPVLIGWSQPSRPGYAMYPPIRHLNAQIRVFVDWMAALFTKVADG